MCIAVFSSCSKKEEAAAPKLPENVTYKVYNRSGEDLISITIGNDKGTSSVTASNIKDGLDIELGYTTTNDGAGMQVTVKMGIMEATVPMEDGVKAITVLENGNLEFRAPEK